MARGDLPAADRVRILAVVRAAEASTGLQFCVTVARPTREPVRRQAERAFGEFRLHTRPAVLVMVVPRARQVEVVTGPAARARVPDEACIDAVKVMTSYFVGGQLTAGIEAGVAALAAAAGPGRPQGHDAPDLIEG